MGQVDASSVAEPSDAAKIDASKSAYADAVLSDHPIAYWRMEDALPGMPLSPHLFDEISKQRMGTRMGTLIAGVQGASGTAFQFDGGYLDLGQDPSYSFAGSAHFSLELWLTVTDTTRFAHILTRELRNPTIGYAIFIYNGTLNFERNVGGADQRTTVSFPPSPAFRHIAAVYDGASLTLTIDGVASATPATGALPTIDAPLLFGTEVVKSTDTFHGVIDEVAIYDTALTPERVRAHFTAPR